jgi:hypothetical protein
MLHCAPDLACMGSTDAKLYDVKPVELLKCNLHSLLPVQNVAGATETQKEKDESRGVAECNLLAIHELCEINWQIQCMLDANCMSETCQGKATWQEIDWKGVAMTRRWGKTAVIGAHN